MKHARSRAGRGRWLIIISAQKWPLHDRVAHPALQTFYVIVTFTTTISVQAQVIFSNIILTIHTWLPILPDLQMRQIPLHHGEAKVIEGLLHSKVRIHNSAWVFSSSFSSTNISWGCITELLHQIGMQDKLFQELDAHLFIYPTLIPDKIDQALLETCIMMLRRAIVLIEFQ